MKRFIAGIMTVAMAATMAAFAFSSSAANAAVAGVSPLFAQAQKTPRQRARTIISDNSFFTVFIIHSLSINIFRVLLLFQRKKRNAPRINGGSFFFGGEEAI